MDEDMILTPEEEEEELPEYALENLLKYLEDNPQSEEEPDIVLVDSYKNYIDENTAKDYEWYIVTKNDYTSLIIYPSANKSEEIPVISKLTTADAMEWDGHKDLIQEVIIKDKVAFETCHTIFRNYSALEVADLENLVTDEVTSFAMMFENCINLKEVKQNFNTPKAINFFGTFNNCQSLTQLDLTNFDTSQGQNFMFMFNNCINLRTLLLRFDTRQGYYFDKMFMNCARLEYIDFGWRFNIIGSYQDIITGMARLTQIDPTPETLELSLDNPIVDFDGIWIKTDGQLIDTEIKRDGTTARINILESTVYELESYFGNSVIGTIWYDYYIWEDNEEAPISRTTTDTECIFENLKDQEYYMIIVARLSNGHNFTGIGSVPAPFSLAENAYSLGEQLVVNGDGILKNNSNFSKFQFTALESYNMSAGSFKTTEAGQYETDYAFPILANNSYQLEIDGKTVYDPSKEEYIDEEETQKKEIQNNVRITFYDYDKARIDEKDYSFIPGTTVKLNSPLKAGDTIIDVDGFTEAWKTQDLNENQKGIIVWDYENAAGYKYPEEIYSKLHYDNIFTDGSIFIDNTVAETQVIPEEEPAPAPVTEDTDDTETPIEYVADTENILSYALYSSEKTSNWKKAYDKYTGTHTITILQPTDDEEAEYDLPLYDVINLDKELVQEDAESRTYYFSVFDLTPHTEEIGEEIVPIETIYDNYRFFLEIENKEPIILDKNNTKQSFVLNKGDIIKSIYLDGGQFDIESELFTESHIKDFVFKLQLAPADLEEWKPSPDDFTIVHGGENIASYELFGEINSNKVRYNKKSGIWTVCLNNVEDIEGSVQDEIKLLNFKKNPLVAISNERDDNLNNNTTENPQDDIENKKYILDVTGTLLNTDLIDFVITTSQGERTLPLTFVDNMPDFEGEPTEEEGEDTTPEPLKLNHYYSEFVLQDGEEFIDLKLKVKDTTVTYNTRFLISIYNNYDLENLDNWLCNKVDKPNIEYGLDIKNNFIILNEPWDGEEFEIGTPLSQHDLIDDSVYRVCDNEIFGENDWKHFTGTIIQKGDGPRGGVLPKAAVFGKVSFDLNIQNVSEVTQYITNISVRTDYTQELKSMIEEIENPLTSIEKVYYLDTQGKTTEALAKALEAQETLTATGEANIWSLIEPTWTNDCYKNKQRIGKYYTCTIYRYGDGSIKYSGVVEDPSLSPAKLIAEINAEGEIASIKGTIIDVLTTDQGGLQVHSVNNNGDKQTSYIKINGNTLQGFNDEGKQYFELGADGFSFGIKEEDKTELPNKIATTESVKNSITEAMEDTIISTDVEYGQSNSTTTSPTKWSTTAPAWEKDKYIWSRTKIVKGDNTTEYSPSENGVCISGRDGQDGQPGAAGDSVSISSTSVKYAATADNTQPDDSAFSVDFPTVENGTYIWTKTIVNYSDGSKTETCSVAYNGIDGTDGQDGTDGNDGKSSYTHIKYADDDNGTGFSSNPTGKTYIGVYTGDSKTAPTSASAYAPWVKFVGEDGQDGEDGADGNGIRAVTYFYKATKNQTKPNASEITQTTIPTVSKDLPYLWQKQVIDFTDNNVADKTEITLIARFGQDGADGQDGNDGIGIVSITEEYYASTSETTQVGSSWKTNQKDWGGNNKYLWTRSHIVWEKPNPDSINTYTTPVLAGAINATAKTANDAATTANSAKDKIDNLKIGGRNLVLESDEPNREKASNTYPCAQYDLVSIITDTEISLQADNDEVTNIETTTTCLQVGETYTYSIDIEPTDVAKLILCLGNGNQSAGGWIDIDSSKGRQIITHTFTATQGNIDKLNEVANCVFVYCRDATNVAGGIFERGTATCVVNSIKLEKGTQATDWTAAPEDISKEIDNSRSGLLTLEEFNQYTSTVLTDESVQDKINSTLQGYLKDKSNDGKTTFNLTDNGITLTTTSSEGTEFQINMTGDGIFFGTRDTQENKDVTKESCIAYIDNQRLVINQSITFDSTSVGPEEEWLLDEYKINDNSHLTFKYNKK